jgi:hypothetical protein
VLTYPLPTLALGYGGESVKAALEPFIEAMRDFNGFMLGVVRRINAVYGRLRTVDREVAMKFNHGMFGIDQVISVHLDLVVLLRAGGTRQGKRKEDRIQG